jgi:hypothetical protein
MQVFLEADMNCRSGRIGLVALVAAILTAGLSGNAGAKTHKGHRYAHKFVYDSRAQMPQQPAQLAPMRYYGGPKSPMWRG